MSDVEFLESARRVVGFELGNVVVFLAIIFHFCLRLAAEAFS